MNKEESAKTVLRRRLLFNRFDFEGITSGDLERECMEETCSYEEAREIFENIPDTAEYSIVNFTTSEAPGYPKEQHPTRLDVTALLVGLIAGGVSIVLIGLLFWYLYQQQCQDDRSLGSARVCQQRNSPSVIIRGPEEVSLNPLPCSPGDADPTGLPSYEQAISKYGPHDVPPPPYPGC
ncbi:transmembrane gamma-carboxyglutamic acid protein 4-like [Scleropages formosus]|uniref:Transmembrane gamma-carboxyglutamic acid protein 4-like n=1 Tax=Scleropages formosus TaxID=113540 RepID=A0A0P7UQF8_SCLFO|nr:transmembrane gamma-carboxyglutamic acid protein 4-like [Scleropages formosus]